MLSSRLCCPHRATLITDFALPAPQSFGSHCWGAEWGLLVAALADGADPNRRVWIDVRRPVVAKVGQRQGCASVAERGARLVQG